MTNKRFTTDNGSNEDVCLVDNVTGNEYESNFEDIVELLNELHEENIQYKQELDNIYLLIGRGDWSGLVDLIKGDVK